MIARTTKRHGIVEARLLDRAIGKELIIKNHYSHKNVNTSTYYIGCYVNGKLQGVASLGVAMNPHPTCKLVEGTGLRNYLELNRLWISDEAGSNIETVFLKLCFRWLKQNVPEVKWIQSFADGRVGVGTIYQASNFLYCGYHLSKFWKDKETKEVFHNSILTRPTRKKYHELQARIDKLESFTVKTYRYIYFIDKSWQKNLKLKTLEYPKKEG